MRRHLIMAAVLLAALWGSVLPAAGQAAAEPPPGPSDEPVMTAAEEPAGVIGTTVETGREAVRGVGEAAVEVGGAIRGGGTQVAEQGRRLWEDAVLPMLQRTAAALPAVLKAIVLLLAFWIVARLVEAGIVKLLGLTKLDDRAARDWGLAPVLEGEGGQKRSAARLVGSVVKWLILLFGFVAFFNALNLEMVARPLQNIVDRITGVVPNLLKAAVILFAYWAVATLVKLGVTRGLGAMKFDERAAKYLPEREIKGEKVGPSALLGRLLFYVILLFGIPPFLEALGQQALVTPLQDMLAKALAFLPNVIAALIIFFVGRVVAVIVREVVSNFLAAAGADEAADRVGVGRIFGERRLSGLVGVIVYFFIIVPIIVAALDALQITAISEPVKGTLGKVLNAVPAVLVAAVIVAVGFAVAKAVGKLVESLLAGIGLDSLPGRVGLTFLQPGEGKPGLSSVVGTFVMVVILLLTAQQALAALAFEQLAGLLDAVVRYLPDLVVGLVVLFVALSLGRYVGRLVGQAAGSSPHAKLLAGVAQYAIVFLGVSMALDQFGVGREIVQAAVWAVLGGLALALGLAFGLGGKDRAKRIVDGGA